ncbi:glycosyltransferase [Halobacteriovorax marinus]|uniref:glycosyltransferase n=1 Tax=Halobacteriovorax marinus TaxID=97084 RepID=UPI003A8F125C
MNILVNALGISSAGGITVLRKLIEEVVHAKDHRFYVFLFVNKNTVSLKEDFSQHSHIQYIFIKNRGLIFRIIYENSFFIFFSRKNKISLIYNFSGTSQIIPNTKQLIKVQNLLFYSRKLDRQYFKSNNYISWIRQILIKRIIFIIMLKFNKFIEVQSNHVSSHLESFINLSSKTLFVKSDSLPAAGSIKNPNNYDFSKKLTFLFIVGPHFHLPHKNIKDFVEAMVLLDKNKVDYEIQITLTKSELESSNLWNDLLDKNTKFLGYLPSPQIHNLFTDNTVLISTSIIETIGLHVLEATLSGCLTITPQEKYSKSVYGDNVLTYKIFDPNSLYARIKNIYTLSKDEINHIIINNQKYIVKNEESKESNILQVFKKIICN